MMKRNKVSTWADGFGMWHAKVHLAVATPSDTLKYDSVRSVARRAIRRELEARGRTGWLNGYSVRVELDKTDLRADNRLYSVTFREKI